MCYHLGATNLFRYATSELSQDAFICWLLSHLTPEGWDADPQVRACAADFMDRVLWNSRPCRPRRPPWSVPGAMCPTRRAGSWACGWGACFPPANWTPWA